MKDCEKIFLIIYVDITGIEPREAFGYMLEIRHSMKYDETVNVIVVPAHKPTHIELLNGVIDEDNQKKIDNLYAAMNEAITKFNDERGNKNLLGMEIPNK